MDATPPGAALPAHSPPISACSMLRRFAPLIAFSVCLGAISGRAEEKSTPAGSGGDITPEQEAFFEKSIRPILVARCFECHGEKKQEAGVRLDSRSGLLKGGESGPAIVSGK